MNPVGESRKNDCCIVVKGLTCTQPPACKSLLVLGRVCVLMIHDEENQVRIRYKTSSRTLSLGVFLFFCLRASSSFFLPCLAKHPYANKSDRPDLAYIR